MKRVKNAVGFLMVAVVAAALGTLEGAWMGGAFAQQPQQREPTASEVMAAMKAVEGQRDFAQSQAANSNATAQQIGERLQAVQKELADLKVKCGDKCEPPKKEEPKK